MMLVDQNFINNFHKTVEKSSGFKSFIPSFRQVSSQKFEQGVPVDWEVLHQFS